MGELRNENKMSVGTPEGKRRFGRPRCRWDDNIEKDPREIGLEGVGFISLRTGTDDRLL
jgi:hypothetical protein